MIRRARGVARSGRGVAAFWMSVVAVASSSLVTVLALSRHLASGELAAVSSVLGISFVCAVVPVAIQSVAGARRAAAGTSTRLPWVVLRPALVVGVVLSPVVATALGLPILAVALPVVQVVPALVVAVGRGELIALRRHRALAVNHLVEAGVRVVAGVALGWVLGAVGVALALLLAMVAALVTLRYEPAPQVEDAAVPGALAALAALTVAIHLDVLLAPRILGGAAADTYSVAALPAKGVFLALMAAGWLVIPSAAERAGWRRLRQPVLRTFAGGLVLTIALVLDMPVLSAVFAKGEPDPMLAAVLGLAMAAAAATWVGVQVLVVKDSSRLQWPPICGLGVVAGVLVVTAGVEPSWGPARLALAVLAGQVAAMGATLHSLLKVARSTPFDRPREKRAHWTETIGLATPEPTVRAPLATIDLRGERAELRDVPLGPTGEPLLAPDGADAPQPVGQRTPRAWLAGISGLLVMACVLQKPGSIVHETKLDIALEPGRFLLRTFHLWEPAGDFGHVQNQAVGYLFPMGPFSLLGNALGVPIWLTQRLFMAALLVAALWGMARLADWLGLGTPASRLVGALAYALSPYVVARLGNTSAMVTGAAFLPWILVLLVRASKLGSTRRAGALAGLAVLLTGGVNAAVTMAVLAVPILWLLTRTPGPRRRSLAAWFAAGTALATLWWLLPLFFQQKYGFDFLPYTERASTTTAFTPTVDVVRGIADWLSYLNLGEAWVPAGWDLVSNPITIVASGLVAALGLTGLVRRDNPERTFLLLVFGAGVLAVGAGFGGAFGNPAAPVVRGLLDGPAGVFRNVFKFTPLIAFAVAMGVTHLVAVVASLRQLTAYAPRVAFAGAAVVLVGALPVFEGKLVSPRGFDAVPGYWYEVAAYHDANAGIGRSLLIPGTAFGDYTWGRPEDEVLQALTDTPWGVRSLIPLGSAGATRMLDSIDATIAKGGSTALPDALARAGVSEVIVRNDIEWRAWNAPRPAQVRRAMDASGLQRVAAFGPSLGELAPAADPPTSALDALVGAGERDLRAVEVYAVPGGALVSSVASAAVPVVSGGPEAVLTLTEQDLAAGAAVLAGDLPADRPAGVPIAQAWIQTDTLARRDTEFGLSRDNTGPVLSLLETGVDGSPVEQLAVYDAKKDPGAQRHETVAEWDGIDGVQASSSGSWLYGIPEAGPANLFDRDIATPWVAGSPVTSVGEWVQVDLGRTAQVAAVDVTPLLDGPWRPAITRVRTTTENGSAAADLEPGATTTRVAVASGPTSWVRITIDAVDGESVTSARAGIGELAIPGIDPHRTIRLPDDLPAGAPPPIVVLQRSGVGATDSLLRYDEEREIDRRVTVRSSTDVRPSGTALPVPSASLDALLSGSPAAANALSISASSTLGDRPEHSPRNLLDGDPGTEWIARPLPTDRAAAMLRAGGALDGRAVPAGVDPVAPRPPASDADPSVTLSWPGVRTVDSLRITPIAGLPQPAEVIVAASDGVARSVVPDVDGWLRFEPLRATSITLSFPILVSAVPTDEPTVTTFGLADVDVPALRSILPPPIADSTPVHVSCGDGPSVSIGGGTAQFSADTTVGDLRRLRPVTLVPCEGEPVRMDAGVLDIRGTRGTFPLVLDTLVLTPTVAVLPTPATLAEGRTAAAVPSEWQAEDRRVQLGGGAATVLVVAENFNVGWEATFAGERLTPIRIDGWKQGFLVPAGAPGIAELRFAPSGPYRASLVLGAVLALLLGGFACVRDRGRRVPALGVSPRELSPAVAAALVGFAAIWVAGIAGAGGLLVALVLRRRLAPVRSHLAPALYLTAVAIVALFPGRLPGDHAGAFGPIVQVLAGLAVVAFLTALLPVTSAVDAGAGEDDGLLVPGDPSSARHAEHDVPTATPIPMRAAVTPGLHGCVPDDVDSLFGPDELPELPEVPELPPPSTDPQRTPHPHREPVAVESGTYF